jgi:uncharacterized protein YjlB
MITMFSKGDFNNFENRLNKNAEIVHKVFEDDGIFPNNNLPVILYINVIEFSEGSDATVVEKIFHYYHSTAHEVLGVYSGSANVRLGGEKGETFKVEKGDVVLIPAGVAHKNLGSSNDFRVVGAYPKGQSWDMNYGKEGERPKADQNINKVPLPDADPVFGQTGPVKEYWN